MAQDLESKIPDNSIVLFHACAHNPTGNASTVVVDVVVDVDNDNHVGGGDDGDDVEDGDNDDDDDVDDIDDDSVIDDDDIDKLDDDDTDDIDDDKRIHLFFYKNTFFSAQA